jgi:hypothetical protein
MVGKASNRSNFLDDSLDKSSIAAAAAAANVASKKGTGNANTSGANHMHQVKKLRFNKNFFNVKISNNILGI